MISKIFNQNEADQPSEDEFSVSMKAEIIKASSVKDNISNFFKSLAVKFTSSNRCDVTVIVNQYEGEGEHKDNMENKENKENLSERNHKKTSIQNRVQQLLPFQFLKESDEQINDMMQEEIQSHSKDEMCISFRSETGRRQSYKYNTQTVKQEKKSAKFKTQQSIKGISSKGIQTSQTGQRQGQNQQQYLLRLNSPTLTVIGGSQATSQTSYELSDGGFIIEKKLNRALQYLQIEDFITLQNFLYQFKEKYSYVTPRVQVKWCFLMANCKQSKKQYERAATNYCQILQILSQNPKIFPSICTDVYHRLGFCYSQIGEWNKGIAAFMQALNQYKKKKQTHKYSQCLNNLGTLYLRANYINQAQRCFLLSYGLKRQQYDKKDSQKLLITLFNILQCNFKLKNYIQAQQIMQLISGFLKDAKHQNYFRGIYNRRRAKLQLMKGNLKQAQCLIGQSLKLLANRTYCRKQYAESLALHGLIKLEQQDYKSSLLLFTESLSLLKGFHSQDSQIILTIKRNIDYATKLIQGKQIIPLKKQPLLHL